MRIELPKSVRVVVKTNGRYLMFYQKKLDSYIFPGGKKEWNEDWAETACREFQEEVGAELLEATLLLEQIHLIPTEDGDKRWIRRIYFADTIRGVVQIQEPDKHSNMSLVALPENPEGLPIRQNLMELAPLLISLPNTRRLY